MRGWRPTEMGQTRPGVAGPRGLKIVSHTLPLTLLEIDMEIPKDLHVAKASHMSVPVSSDIEFHLTKTDVPDVECEVGDHYMVMVPSICTSIDKGNIRFKQTGTLKVAETPEPVGAELLEGLDQ